MILLYSMVLDVDLYDTIWLQITLNITQYSSDTPDGILIYDRWKCTISLITRYYISS